MWFSFSLFFPNSRLPPFHWDLVEFTSMRKEGGTEQEELVQDATVQPWYWYTLSLTETRPHSTGNCKIFANRVAQHEL